MNKMKRHIILLVILLFVSIPLISEANSHDVIRLILPGKSWALQFDFKDFEIQDQGFLTDFKEGSTDLQPNRLLPEVLPV